ncbi:transposase [Catenulispora sp. GAS73]|uniref:transposase n=1 Tax=Catenulispora sp. GAS73 TaxID=3156269 RepID=UPI0035157484
MIAPHRDHLGVARGDLSDAQWAALEPLLPVAATGRPALFQRRLIDGVRHRVGRNADAGDVLPGRCRKRRVTMWLAARDFPGQPEI